MVFTKSCPEATSKTRLVFHLCCPLFFFGFHQARATQHQRWGRSEQSHCIWLIFASEDWNLLQFSEATVVFKVFITNYSIQIKRQCILGKGERVGFSAVTWGHLCSRLAIASGTSCPFCLIFIVLDFCSFWEQSLVPPLFCGFSLNQCCYGGSRVHGRMGCEKGFESYWTRGTR